MSWCRKNKQINVLTENQSSLHNAMGFSRWNASVCEGKCCCCCCFLCCKTFYISWSESVANWKLQFPIWKAQIFRFGLCPSTLNIIQFRGETSPFAFAFRLHKAKLKQYLFTWVSEWVHTMHRPRLQWSIPQSVSIAFMLRATNSLGHSLRTRPQLLTAPWNDASINRNYITRFL